MAGPTGHHLVAWRMARLDEGCEQIKILTYGEWAIEIDYVTIFLLMVITAKNGLDH